MRAKIDLGLGTIETMHDEGSLSNFEYMLLGTQMKIIEDLDDIVNRLEGMDAGKQ